MAEVKLRFSEEEKGEGRSKRRIPKPSKGKTLVTLVIVALIAVSGYLYWQNQQTQAKLAKLNPNQSTQEEAQALVKKVGAIVSLPGDETPTVATVVDVEKLKSQAFFKNAKNGDKVLLYAKAKKAYLYRPNENKLIEVATLNINANSQATPADQTKNATPTTPTKK